MTTSITLIHSVKNSPEDWFDNYKQTSGTKKL